MGSPRAVLELRRHVLFDHRPESTDAPGLADVGMLRQAVGGAHHVGSQPELGRAQPVGLCGRLGLQPVEEAEAHTLGVLQRGCDLRCGSVEDAHVAVVVPRPVEHRDVAAGDAGESRRVDQSPVRPQRALRAGRLLEEPVREPAALFPVDLAAVHLDREAVRLRVPVVLVLLGPLGAMTLRRRRALEGERVREALHAAAASARGAGRAARRSPRPTRRRCGSRRRRAAAGHRARWRRSRSSAGSTGAPLRRDRSPSPPRPGRRERGRRPASCGGRCAAGRSRRTGRGGSRSPRPRRRARRRGASPSRSRGCRRPALDRAPAPRSARGSPAAGRSSSRCRRSSRSGRARRAPRRPATSTARRASRSPRPDRSAGRVEPTRGLPRRRPCLLRPPAPHTRARGAVGRPGRAEPPPWHRRQRGRAPRRPHVRAGEAPFHPVLASVPAMLLASAKRCGRFLESILGGRGDDRRAGPRRRP